MADNDIPATCCGCPKSSECNSAPEPSPDIASEAPSLPQEAMEEEAQPSDPTIQFDESRGTRQSALQASMEVVKRYNAGAKIDRKDIGKALKNLTAHAILLDELVVIMLSEMYRTVQVVAQNEVSLFTLRANLKAVVVGMVRKGLITDEELTKIFTDEVLPEMMPKTEEEEKS